MTEKLKRQPQCEDYVRYIRSNEKYCDEWTKKFIKDMEERLKEPFNPSPKQYNLLLQKSKDIYFKNHSAEFIQDVFKSF
jgi:hypothetical protein